MKTTESQAAAFVATAVAAIPSLTRFGVGIFEQSERRHEQGTAWLKARIAEGQAELGLRLDEVAIAADWIKLQVPTATVNTRCTSYTYKHDVENWKAKGGEPAHVSNGAFIAAAIGLGFKFKIQDDGPNVYFAFSAKSLKAIR